MISIHLDDSAELLDVLPYTGLYDLTDCYIRVRYNPEVPVSELERISTILNSMIHVLDINFEQKTYGPAMMVDIDDEPLDEKD